MNENRKRFTVRRRTQNEQNERDQPEKREADALMAYTDRLIGLSSAARSIKLRPIERERLEPLFRLSDRLNQSMPPVRPSAAFVQSLGQDLVEKAKRQALLTQQLRRSALIGAAAVGSLLSIASLVGAIVFIVARIRQRTRAQTAQVPSA
ncbi:MAG TPA: hypothetical protein ENN19_17165 [Chloroflexi bacterium]|nr:hypothetical protein [Chloroflexota bacterium]